MQADTIGPWGFALPIITIGTGIILALTCTAGTKGKKQNSDRKPAESKTQSSTPQKSSNPLKRKSRDSNTASGERSLEHDKVHESSHLQTPESSHNGDDRTPKVIFMPKGSERSLAVAVPKAQGDYEAPISAGMELTDGADKPGTQRKEPPPINVVKEVTAKDDTKGTKSKDKTKTGENKEKINTADNKDKTNTAENKDRAKTAENKQSTANVTATKNDNEAEANLNTFANVPDLKTDLEKEKNAFTDTKAAESKPVTLNGASNRNTVANVPDLTTVTKTKGREATVKSNANTKVPTGLNDPTASVDPEEQFKVAPRKNPVGELKPRKFRKQGKSLQIQAGLVKPKRRGEYPTMEDVVSDWDSDKAVTAPSEKAK